MKERENQIEEEIRRRIFCGELPSCRPNHRVYGGSGDGISNCSCCGNAITTADSQYDVEQADSASDLLEEVSMHIRCYSVWRRVSELLRMEAPPKKRIFQIAYSRELMCYRSSLLRTRGYEVTSAVGNEAAKTLLMSHFGATYDLFIIGRAAPAHVRFEIACWIRTQFPEGRIVALHPEEDQRIGGLNGLEYNANDGRPQVWVPLVAAALRKGGIASASVQRTPAERGHNV